MHETIRPFEKPTENADCAEALRREAEEAERQLQEAAEEQRQQHLANTTARQVY